MSYLINVNEVHGNIAESKELMNAKVIRVAVFSVSQKIMIKNHLLKQLIQHFQLHKSSSHHL